VAHPRIFSPGKKYAQKLNARRRQPAGDGEAETPASSEDLNTSRLPEAGGKGGGHVSSIGVNPQSAVFNHQTVPPRAISGNVARQHGSTIAAHSSNLPAHGSTFEVDGGVSDYLSLRRDLTALLNNEAIATAPSARPEKSSPLRSSTTQTQTLDLRNTDAVCQTAAAAAAPWVS
jgi:hypothetical protein